MSSSSGGPRRLCSAVLATLADRVPWRFLPAAVLLVAAAVAVLPLNWFFRDDESSAPVPLILLAIGAPTDEEGLLPGVARAAVGWCAGRVSAVSPIGG